LTFGSIKLREQEVEVEVEDLKGRNRVDTICTECDDAIRLKGFFDQSKI